MSDNNILYAEIKRLFDMNPAAFMRALVELLGCSRIVVEYGVEDYGK